MVEVDGGLRLEVEGAGFLYKMARHMVGALLAVASGSLPAEQLAARLEQGGAGNGGSGSGDTIATSSGGPVLGGGKYRGWNVAPACGLMLVQVRPPSGLCMSRRSEQIWQSWHSQPYLPAWSASNQQRKACFAACWAADKKERPFCVRLLT